MSAEIVDENIEDLKHLRAVWIELMKRWDNLTVFDPAPPFTRKYSQKMVDELDKKIEALTEGDN